MGREWTLEAANEMLGEVRKRTERAANAVDALEARARESDAEGRKRLARDTLREVGRWMREMEALGVEVRGPWRVEFACAEGAYAWAWPDARLRFRARDDEEAGAIH